MPTALTLLSKAINQKLTEVTFPAYCLNWCPIQEEWIYKPFKPFLYFLFNLANLIFIGLFLLGLLKFVPEGLLTFKQVMMSGLIVQAIFFAVFIDMMILENGRDWVNVTNWICLAVDFYHPKGIRLGSDRSLKGYMEAVVKEHKKLYKWFLKGDRREHPDWLGLVLFSTVVSYTAMFTFGPIFFVFGNFDPIYLTILSVKSISFLKDNPLVVILRLGICIMCAQAMVLPMRTAICLTFSMAVRFLESLIQISSLPFSPHAFKSFKELLFGSIYINHIAANLMSVMLTLGFTLMVIGSNVMLLGVKIAKPSLFFMSATVTAFILAGVLFNFYCCRTILERSAKAVRRWKFEVSTGAFLRWGRRWGINRLEVVKRLEGCQLMCMQLAGSGSVMNVELEVGYLNSTLMNAVNVMMLYEEFNLS